MSELLLRSNCAASATASAAAAVAASSLVALGFWFGMACLGLNISYRWEKRVGRVVRRVGWAVAIAVAVAVTTLPLPVDDSGFTLC